MEQGAAQVMVQGAAQANVAKVAVAAVPYAIDKPYDYLIPGPLRDKLQAGMRVTVPFGRGNKLSEAMVLGTVPLEETGDLKSVTALLDEEPVLDSGGIRLALWMRERYFCTLFEAVRTILPAGLWYRIQSYWRILPDRPAEELLKNKPKAALVYQSLEVRGGEAEVEALKLRHGTGVTAILKELEALGLVEQEVDTSRRVRDKMVQRVRLAIPPEEALAEAEAKRRSAPLRYEVVKLLCAAGSGLVSEICYFTGASRATIRGLVKAGVCVAVPEEAYRVPWRAALREGEPIQLNGEQERAFSGIMEQFRSGKPTCSLLYGVTGSGKTLVYIRLLQEVVKAGRQGMILVPEIALTPQMMERFSAYFGDRVVMLHSALKVSERYDQWKRIRRGEVDIVLGTRSAVFAPLDKLGMIILDEEHEASYQSESQPRYHARDIAKFRCSRAGAALVLGSATPAVDSAWQAKRGVYHLFSIESRYNAQPLPQVIIADMRQELRRGRGRAIGQVLREELRQNLQAGEQSILFLNRRGNSHRVVCIECGAVPQCPRCSVPLTYHSANRRLMCHYCGYSQPFDELCEECAGPVKYIGAGTQKVEEELAELFPGTEILRMDADTAAGRHEKLLHTFVQKKIPILLGTQMVAKGLDFENVTLVGVLAADMSLYMDHYLAGERTFDLLTQVVGRAGRGEKKGRAVIQTYTPDNEVIACAARQDYRTFLRGELRLRRDRHCPPFADMFTLTVSGRQEGEVIRASAQLRDGLRQALRYPSAANMAVELLGPAPAPVVRVNDRFRYRLFWVGRNDHTTREILGYYLKAFQEQRENRALSLTIDCNTME